MVNKRWGKIKSLLRWLEYIWDYSWPYVYDVGLNYFWYFTFFSIPMLCHQCRKLLLHYFSPFVFISDTFQFKNPGEKLSIDCRDLIVCQPLYEEPIKRTKSLLNRSLSVSLSSTRTWISLLLSYLCLILYDVAFIPLKSKSRLRR